MEIKGVAKSPNLSQQDSHWPNYVTTSPKIRKNLIESIKTTTYFACLHFIFHLQIYQISTRRGVWPRHETMLCSLALQSNVSLECGRITLTHFLLKEAAMEQPSSTILLVVVGGLPCITPQLSPCPNHCRTVDLPNFTSSAASTKASKLNHKEPLAVLNQDCMEKFALGHISMNPIASNIQPASQYQFQA